MTNGTATSRGGWLVAILWAAFIFILSSIPGWKLDFVPPIWGWDKLAHVVLYAVLGVLILRALGFRRAAFGLAIIFSVAYGLFDELHQVFVPGRTPSLADLAADAVGSTIGVMLLGKQILRFSRRKQDSAPREHVENEQKPSQ